RRADPRRQLAQELRRPDRARGAGGPRYRGEGARVLRAVNRRARRPGRRLRRDAERGRQLGQARPGDAPRHGGLLLRLDDRAAAADGVRARRTSPAQAEAALRAAGRAHGEPRPRVSSGARFRPRRRPQATVVSTFARERDVAVRAAREAGAIVLRYYVPGIAARREAPHNPVT